MARKISKIPFGKYRGQLITQVAREDARYLRWLLSGTDWGEDHSGIILDALQSADEEMLATAPAIALTAHQQECADRLLTAMRAGSHVVRLEGGAGYGKSYVTKEIAAQSRRSGMTVNATAVSYVATQVLAQQLDPYGVETGTLARTLKFAVRYEQGQEVYEHSLDTAVAVSELLAPNHVLIVDECSMINDRDASLLLDAAGRYGGYLVLVGDSHQLPPVKQESISQCCSIRLEPEQVAQLKIPMRYTSDSHLYAVERSARSEIVDTVYGHNGVLRETNKELFVAQKPIDLLKQYTSQYRADPGAQHRMLLFRRRDVINANNRIRKDLFGPDADTVELDEQLMILRTGDTPFDSDDPIRYYSGQTFRVLEKHAEKYAIEIDGTLYEIPCLRAQLDDHNPPVRLLFAVTENQMDATKLGGPEFQAALAAAITIGLEKENWTPYRQLLMDFVRVAYQYATTVHRAQGQTLDYAYCHPSSLLAARGLMGTALAYVALTRAKKHLSVLQPQPRANRQ